MLSGYSDCGSDIDFGIESFVPLFVAECQLTERV
jgi:hypothetical protein